MSKQGLPPWGYDLHLDFSLLLRSEPAQHNTAHVAQRKQAHSTAGLQHWINHSLTHTHTHTHTQRVLGKCTGQSGFNGPPPQFSSVTMAALPSVQVLTKIHIQLHILTYTCAHRVNEEGARPTLAPQRGSKIYLWLTDTLILLSFASPLLWLSHPSPTISTDTKDLPVLCRCMLWFLVSCSPSVWEWCMCWVKTTHAILIIKPKDKHLVSNMQKINK